MSPKTAKASATTTRVSAAGKLTAPAVAAHPGARIAPKETSPVSRLGAYDLRQKIAERAFLIFEKRGRVDGYHQQDWIEAEAQIKRELKTS